MAQDQDLIGELRSKNVQVEVQGKTIKVRGPKGVLDDALLSRIRRSSTMLSNEFSTDRGPGATIAPSLVANHRFDIIKTIGDPDCLILLQRGSSRYPMFFVHSLQGGTGAYLHMLKGFKSSQTVYAFQALGIYQDRKPLPSIEAMAEYYVKQLMLVQKTGPYFLCGWSLGGQVAFEMAQLLSRRSERVALLVILDTHGKDETHTDMQRRWHHFWGAVTLEKDTRACEDLRGSWTLTDEDKLRYLFSYAEQNTGFWNPMHSTPEKLRKSWQFFNHMYDISGAYRPRQYAGSLFYFQSDLSPAADYWCSLATDGATTVRFGGDHSSIMLEPICLRMAEKIQSLIDELTAGHSSSAERSE